MKPTDLPTKLRSKVKAELKPRVDRVLKSAKERDLPHAALQMPIVKGMAKRTMRAIDLIEKGATKAEKLKLGRRAVNSKSASVVLGGLDEVRHVLEKALKKPMRVAEAPAPRTKRTPTHRETDKPMPEMIKTKGGKRLPAAVAKTAVRKANVGDFKPKKGQK